MKARKIRAKHSCWWLCSFCLAFCVISNGNSSMHKAEGFFTMWAYFLLYLCTLRQHKSYAIDTCVCGFAMRSYFENKSIFNWLNRYQWNNFGYKVWCAWCSHLTKCIIIWCIVHTCAIPVCIAMSLRFAVFDICMILIIIYKTSCHRVAWQQRNTQNSLNGWMKEYCVRINNVGDCI